MAGLDWKENIDRRKEISAQLAKILAEHDGLESNIPVNDATNYWSLKKELNGLSSVTSGNKTS